jgi:NAD(P)-dependent dehydrogenase (short-subunit alcohol dehydrogenase family)
MNSQKRTLADRAAVVTGASKGLGRAIAEEFVKEGASVMLVARNEHPLLRARDDLARLVNRPGQIVEAFLAEVSIPIVRVLVSNAGVLGRIGRLDDID